MLQILGETIFNFLMIFPGAFIRWMFGGFKKKYSYYIDNGTYVNVFVSGLALTVIVLLLKDFFS
jgi:hypothetical protein